MNTKRVMSTVIVSFICILLASSFVLQTSAETIETVANLQGATVVDAVIPDGFEGEQVDHEFVSDLSVSDAPFVPSYNPSSYKFYSSFGGYPVPFNMDGVSQIYMLPLEGSFSLYIYKDSSCFVREVPLSLSHSKCFFLDDYIFYSGNTGFTIFDYQGNTVRVVESSYVYYNFFVVFSGDYFYVFSYRSALDGSIWCGFYDSSFNFLSGEILETVGSIYYPSFCYYDGFVYCFIPYETALKLISFDVSSLSVISSFLFYFDFSWGPYPSSVALNGFLYVFSPSSFEMIAFDLGSDFSSYYNVDLLISSWFTCYYSRASIGVYSSTLCIAGDSSYLCYSFDVVNCYYNMIDYSTDASFVPDRYLNFSYLANSDVGVNGGGYVGFELDFGVPDYFYQNNEVTAFRFECMVGSCSNDSETFQGGIPPLTVEVVGGDNWLPVLNGKMVAKVGDVYLWAFTCLVYTSNDGPIRSLKITLNQYIPVQTEMHSFSIPVSALTLERWEDTSSAVEDLKGDITIIGNQIGQTNEKLDEIQNILTSTPENHESNMQEWSNIMSEQEENESVVGSYAESFFHEPSLDESLMQGVSKGQDLLGGTLSGDSSAIWGFFKYLWEVHPQMSLMAGIVITLSIGMLCIRMS